MSKQAISEVIYRDLGIMRYAEALAEQHKCHESVVGGGNPLVLTVQHPNVLTLGKNSTENNLLFLTHEQEPQREFEIFRTDRGGDVTAHMPGQLVVYPILPILQMKLTPKKYVERLEQVVIDTLQYYGLPAARNSDYPGVWVNEKKICAVGVRISARVSMHGIALNINNDFGLFEKIVPCGIIHLGVTSLARELHRDVQVSDVQRVLLENFKKIFSVNSRNAVGFMG